MDPMVDNSGRHDVNVFTSYPGTMYPATTGLTDECTGPFWCLMIFGTVVI